MSWCVLCIIIFFIMVTYLIVLELSELLSTCRLLFVHMFLCIGLCKSFNSFVFIISSKVWSPSSQSIVNYHKSHPHISCQFVLIHLFSEASFAQQIIVSPTTWQYQPIYEESVNQLLVNNQLAHHINLIKPFHS